MKQPATILSALSLLVNVLACGMSGSSSDLPPKLRRFWSE